MTDQPQREDKRRSPQSGGPANPQYEERHEEKLGPEDLGGRNPSTEDWGERQDVAKEIAAGGKEYPPVPGMPAKKEKSPGSD